MAQDPEAVSEAGVKWADRLQLAQVAIVSVEDAAIKSRILSDNRVMKKRARSAVRK